MCDIYALDIFQAGFAEPLFDKRDARQVMDISHATVTIFRNEHFRFIGFDYEGFEYELAAGLDQVTQVGDMLLRVAAMIEQPHGENSIEMLTGAGDVFDSKRQNSSYARGDVFVQGLELHNVDKGRLKAYDCGGSFAEHTKDMIAATATDVENNLAGERFEVRFDAVPFPVAAPFGIDIYAEDLERSFAPWMELHEGMAKLVLLGFGDIGWCAYDHSRRVELDHGRQQIGHGIDSGLPAVVIAVVKIFECCFDMLVELHCERAFAKRGQGHIYIAKV